MKRAIVVAILVPLLLAVGCAQQKQQVKVTYQSDPPGGTLYKQNDDLWGPCPKALWYDLDEEAAERGYLDAKGLAVRWPSGPEKRSNGLIRILVDGTDRRVTFIQPKEKPKALDSDLYADKSEESEKGGEWQKARESYSTETERIRTSPALISEKPIVADKPVESQPGQILTLDPGRLVQLDWSSRNRRHARVETKRVVSGPGVEFDIYFPSNSPDSCSLSFVSSGAGGRGSLIGANISAYEAFALKLTLVSVNGLSDPNLKQKLVVGAVIGPTATGRLSSYEPVTLGLGASEKTVTAVTPVSADEVYEIGFHIHAENRQYWDAAGSRVVLRVEPVEAGQAGPFNSSKSLVRTSPDNSEKQPKT